jgi:integrase
VEKLIAAARGNRWGQRDATMILITFRHGLRASELCELQWSDVEFETGNLHLRRAKGGATGTHVDTRNCPSDDARLARGRISPKSIVICNAVRGGNTPDSCNRRAFSGASAVNPFPDLARGLSDDHRFFCASREDVPSFAGGDCSKGHFECDGGS